MKRSLLFARGGSNETAKCVEFVQGENLGKNSGAY